jgi:hypothetical protein
MPAKHSVKLRRPSLPPILEIDEDGVPTADFSFIEGRRWSGEDGDDPTVSLSEWPTEFDD